MRTRVKICGITNTDDAFMAAEAGADALGYVFAPGSPRQVAPATVAGIIKELPPFVTNVGVFVNESVERVSEIAMRAGVDMVQLHGDEDADYCSMMEFPVIKAVRVGSAGDLEGLGAYDVAAFLLDTYKEGVSGGTGETFDWDIADSNEARGLGRLILSGGLTPDNVIEAVRKVTPYCLDASSGVESEPGRKDHQKVREFIEKVRCA